EGAGGGLLRGGERRERGAVRAGRARGGEALPRGPRPRRGVRRREGSPHRARLLPPRGAALPGP
ncbi:MAG: hypothetical protein ACK56F_10615, partial [bacterium]